MSNGRAPRLLYWLAAATLAMVSVTTGVLISKGQLSGRNRTPGDHPASIASVPARSSPALPSPAPTTPTPTTRATAIAPEFSGLLAAVTTDGDVVLVDPGTAAVVRRIYSADGGPAEQVAWHAPSGVVYFARRGVGCSSVWRYRIHGGANPGLLTNGERLAVSPDGTKLAVSTCRDKNGGSINGIAVVDAASGKPALAIPLSIEPVDQGGGMWSVGDIDWRPDGRALVVTAGWEGDDEQFLIDLRKPPRSVTTAPRVSVQRPDVSFHETTYLGQRLVLYGTCCFPEDTRSRVAVRDGKTGALTDLKASEAPGLAADSSGRLRYLSTRRSESGALWALDRLDGVPRKIGGDFLAIDW